MRLHANGLSVRKGWGSRDKEGEKLWEKRWLEWRLQFSHALKTHTHWFLSSCPPKLKNSLQNSGAVSL